jgi:hypothetical protein
MMKLTLPVALLVAAALTAQPAMAQKGGRGNGNGNGKHQSGEVRGNRDHDRDKDRDRDRDHDDDRWDDRDDRRDDRTWRSSNSTRLQRRVPPGWCIGRGNPHNTVANCGPGNSRYDRRYDPRYNRSGTTTDRYGNRTYDRSGTYSGRAGYDAWKRDHDLRCRELSRQRPLDLRWQLQVRNQCAAETAEARRRYGV